MKIADDVNTSGETTLYCNSCGRMLKVVNGILMEDAFEAVKEWGYFSEHDMEVHHFNLCEDCYQKIIAEFKLPVVVKNKMEVL